MPTPRRSHQIVGCFLAPYLSLVVLGSVSIAGCTPPEQPRTAPTVATEPERGSPKTAPPTREPPKGKTKRAKRYLTVDQALKRGLRAKLKAAPLSGDGLLHHLVGYSPSVDRRFAALLHAETGAVRIIGATSDGAGEMTPLRTVPDDIVWK